LPTDRAAVLASQVLKRLLRQEQDGAPESAHAPLA
jgi:hypothetical protein